MKGQQMKGKLIVIEGVNGAGKTTIAKGAYESLTDLIEHDIEYNMGHDTAYNTGYRYDTRHDTRYDIEYNQGFANNSRWERFINEHPHSFLYYINLAKQTKKKIMPALEAGKVLLQDRYVQTVDAYLPDSEWLHNNIMRAAFDPLFLTPDLYIHVTASPKIAAQRLAKSSNSYKRELSLHPEKIEENERRYMEIFHGMRCPKFILDTTNKAPQDCIDRLVKIIKETNIC